MLVVVEEGAEPPPPPSLSAFFFLYNRKTEYFKLFHETITYFWNRLWRISKTEVKTSSIVNFMWKYCIVNVVKQLKSYGFGKVSSPNCLKQISINQEYLVSQNHFQLDNSYAFPKAILHEYQRLCKFKYRCSSFVYRMSDDAVHYTDCVRFLSTEKQRSFGSFVNKNIPQKPNIRYRESVSLRCCIGSPWNHREVWRST